MYAIRSYYVAGYPAAGLAQALTGGRRRNLVCVAGATSQVGVFLLPRLRSAGFRSYNFV